MNSDNQVVSLGMSHARKALQSLRDLQWTDEDELGEDGYCPSCLCDNKHVHRRTCDLAASIKSLEAAIEAAATPNNDAKDGAK